MKRATVAVAVIALAAGGWAQQQGSTAPAAQTPPAAAGQATTPPAGKRPPQAKTQPEFDAYNAAKAQVNNPTEMEKSVDDFATKFPNSELTILLYRDLMHGYQSANNADKMLDTGRKVLKLDPDDPEALIGVAEVLSERTKDTDLDKDQRVAEATKLAAHALETIDTDVVIPAGTPQERVDAYKGFLRSSAEAILGTLAFNASKYTEAESHFRKSIDDFPAQPDPIVVLRLAVSLDQQGKYAEALKEANHAVDLTQDNTPAGTAARHERDRLVQLTGGIPTSSSTPSAPSTPPPSNPPPKN
ncbi:MAG TPA: tetratricopeptide repeat protein [Terriglobales bacterium]|nr:tetratricopeptide repeat protein [Terriglobales bacterium]